MREIFTSGTVGGALGNQCFYPEIHSFTVLEVILYLQSMSTLSSWNAVELRLHYSLEKGNDHDSPKKDYGGASLAGIDFRFFASSFARS